MSSIPLDPGPGGQCIAPSALQPADIITSTTAAAVSGVIRAATFSEVSHAMLYVGEDQVIEAIGEGVVRRSLADALNGARLAVAYRRRDITLPVANRVINAAQALIGRGYDHTGAAGAGIRANPVLCSAVGIIPCAAAHVGAFNNRARFFCSELVLEAFRQANVPIIDGNPGTATPQDIVRAYSRRILLYVGHLVT